MSSITRWKLGSPCSALAVSSTSAFIASLSSFSLSVTLPFSTLSLRPTLARPSLMHTITTLPTSPLFCALMPVLTATLMACASGEPPPHGIVSSRRLAMAIDRVGGSSTSASVPWNVMREILSRLSYALDNREMAAPLAAFMRLRAMEPLASTTKTMSAPAFLAMRLTLTSASSMKTFLSLPLLVKRFLSSFRARCRLGRW
mmetsp:Transcript_8043/g.19807  ORF Transcript_8043/g.19807 Transcript_8043/m.19807 type:complete len:201 (+) Transcript_8043:371-973(+)